MDIENAAAAISGDLFGGDSGEGSSPAVADSVVPAPSELPDTEVGGEVPVPEAVVPSEGGDAPEVPAESVVPSAPAKPAPTTWRAEAQATWDALPDLVKDEVIKRETDIMKGIEQYKGDASIGKVLKNSLTPHMQLFQQHNINPIKHVEELLSLSAGLVTGTPEHRRETIAALAQQFGVDLSDYAPAYVDPTVDKLQKEVQSLRQAQQTQFQAAQQARFAEVSAQVTKFASDASKPHFADVLDDMTQLVKSGQAATLEDAYEKAIWLNPAVRSKELARLQTEAAEKAAKDKAEHAKRAATAASVNVRARSQESGTTIRPGSMDETLAATLAEIKSRTSR